jgi:hypothetical protein
MQHLSPKSHEKTSLPADLNLLLCDTEHWLKSSFGSSMVHVLPDEVARLTRQELDIIFSNGPGIAMFSLNRFLFVLQLGIRISLNARDNESAFLTLPLPLFPQLTCRPHVAERSICTKSQTATPARDISFCIAPQPPTSPARTRRARMLSSGC